MTRHRKPQEWIEEILEAASCEIDANGYAAFTIDSIVRRVELSKGGVYRFFKNKKEVALSLFTKCYRNYLDVDVHECVAWNMTIEETVFRVIFRFNVPENVVRRNDRIWIQLLPEVLANKHFKEKRELLLSQIHIKIEELVRAVTKRDAYELPKDFETKISTSIAVGIALLEGVAVQSALGTPFDQQVKLTKSFFKILVAQSLGGSTLN